MERQVRPFSKQRKLIERAESFEVQDSASRTRAFVYFSDDPSRYVFYPVSEPRRPGQRPGRRLLECRFLFLALNRHQQASMSCRRSPFCAISSGPPDGMMAIELDDGRHVVAPEGGNLATVKLQGGEGIMMAVPAGVKVHLALGHTAGRSCHIGSQF